MQKSNLTLNSLEKEQELIIGIEPLESVQEPAYLSRLLTGDGIHVKEIYMRIRMNQGMADSLPLSLKINVDNNRNIWGGHLEFNEEAREVKDHSTSDVLKMTCVTL